MITLVASPPGIPSESLFSSLTGLGISVKDVQDDFHVTDVSNDYLGIENGGEVKADVAVNRDPSNLQITADAGKAGSTESNKRCYKRLGACSFQCSKHCPEKPVRRRTHQLH
jgi:hypothetical protein